MHTQGLGLGLGLTLAFIIRGIDLEQVTLNANTVGLYQIIKLADNPR